MLRKIVLAIAFVYFVALAAFIVLLLQGRPRDSGVPEIGFGRWEAPESFVYISGRRLACAPFSADRRFTTRCTVPIADGLLTVRARPANVRPGHFEGACEAEYQGQSYPCRPDVHRGTVRPIALIEGSLDLSEEQLETLRDRYWVENGRFPSLHLLAVVSTLVVLAAVVAWRPPSPGKGRMRLAGYVVAASLTFVFSCALLFGVTLYLWD